MARNDGNNYPHGEVGGKPIREFVYEDENGEPYLRVVKTDKHKYPQYHWVEGDKMNTKGAWEKGPPDGPKKPYMLPQLINTDKSEPVFVTEGEKDAESVIDLGLVATCNSEGAGKWSVELNKWFKGRDTVYVLEDNDAPGRKHVRRVANNLMDIVENVHIVTFRDLDEHEDVSDWLAEYGGTKELLLERAAKSPKVKSRRAIIRIVDGELSRIVEDTERAIIDSGQPVLNRSGILVQPIWTSMAATKRRKTKVSVMAPLDVGALRFIVNKHAAHYVKYDKRSKSDVFTNPPLEVLDTLLRKGHWGFPPISGIINSPTIRPDGSVIDKPGYDAETRLWYACDDDFKLPKIPTNPTMQQAKKALKMIKDLLCEFPFVQPEDRSVAIAALLSSVLRGSFMLCPMFMFQAHTAGTGKSYMANLISNLVRGRSCPVITVSNSEEMEKRLGSLILQSVPMFSLDNCTENVGGSLLCQLVEQPLIGIRVLGKSQLIECEWRGVVFATGNNVSVVGDMARRTLICTLDANVERPEMRRFKFNPVEQVLENRGEYVAAALTIARAYFYEEEKHKIKCESIASYDEWSRAVREPLIWLGEADPVVGMNKARDEDPERNMALILAQEWVKHMQPLTKPRKAEEIARIASERDANGNDLEWQPKRPELYELLLERCGMPNGRGIEVRRLGRWLRQLRGQVHGGFRFNLFGGDTHRGHNWMLQPIDFG